MKIICIGRNYAEHAKELKNEIPSEPVIFLKPDTAVLLTGETFLIPDFSNDIHYECEIVVKIAKNGKHIREEFAPRYYNEVGLGIDFTARDIQQRCKEKGLPWERAKAFDHSAVVGKFLKTEDFPEWKTTEFQLKKNGEIVQKASTELMLFSIDRIISEVSAFITLRTGDLIYTGTPAGVGRVEKGDRLEGSWGENRLLETRIG